MHPDKLDANQDIEKAKEEFMLVFSFIIVWHVIQIACQGIRDPQ